MSHERVNKVVSGFVPCRHMSWGDERKPKLPWAVYYGEETSFSADNVRYAAISDWTVELYEERRDAALEKRLGDAINEAFGPYTREETWVKSEGVLLVTYTFREIEGDQKWQSQQTRSASA